MLDLGLVLLQDFASTDNLDLLLPGFPADLSALLACVFSVAVDSFTSG